METSRYSITIRRDDIIQPAAETTLTVDYSTGGPTITQVHVDGAGSGLQPGDLPVIDLGALVLALQHPGAGVPLASSGTPKVTASSGSAGVAQSGQAASSDGSAEGVRIRSGSRRPSARSAAVKTGGTAAHPRSKGAKPSASEKSPTSRKPSRVSAKRTAEPTSQTATASIVAPEVASKATRSRAKKSVPAAGADTQTTGRPYRTMPEASEVNSVYLQEKTIAGVARHYKVPAHTARGWVSRLPQLGFGSSKA